MSFKLSIVAPSGKIFEETVDSIAVNGTEGGFEVYSRHTPLISSFKAGQPVCAMPTVRLFLISPAAFWKSTSSIM